MSGSGFVPAAASHAGTVPLAVRRRPLTASLEASAARFEHTGASARWGLAAPSSAAVVATVAAAARRFLRQPLPGRRVPVVSRGGGGGDIEDLVPFELRGFSLAQVVLGIGVFLIGFGFTDYFYFGVGGSGIGGLVFIYAVPAFLLGAALAYAELLPVEVETAAGAEGLFDKLATSTLKKIKSDVTRHRYGDDAHLDLSLKALGLVDKGRYPQLEKIVESKSADGELEFTMLFKSKEVPFTYWNSPEKKKAFDRFFGPGLWSQVWKYDAANRVAALRLTTGVRPEVEPEPNMVAEKVDEEEKRIIV